MEDKYFKRNVDEILLAWSRTKPPDRKPLLMRGARQIGKSSAVRQLGKKFEHFVEVNFDENKEAKAFFETSLTPRKICDQLALYYHTPIIPGKTLLFFDEIQSCQPALAKLRYFYEKYPELHVAAAGSLLEFALEEIPSFGVGRIRSLFMYPFGFDEFLTAMNEEGLCEAVRKASVKRPLAGPIHQRLLQIFKIFLICGGMPEAVSQYVRKRDLLNGELVLNDLITVLKTDFAKYRKASPLLLLNEVFESVMRQTEGKFVYERAAPGTPAASVRQALDLLIMAGLVHPVTHTAANGIPLGAEKNAKYRRIIPCDTGIFLYSLGLRSEILPASDFSAVNRGSLAEVFTGLELLKAASCYAPQQLFCWQRSANPGSSHGSAQVDFLVQKGSSIIPIEVKSGTQGGMQSLRLFMKEKNIKKGVRTSLENFGCRDDIDIYPLYAIGNIARDGR
ncbi:MAG: AAA family ATPase [Treponema sp.]|jgi:predicted AAA+ superfamily ATPase|nr:AAA family ATPase [Treponema sp.]